MTVTEEYFWWIREQVTRDPFNILPIFCDWLDENNIKSQQWREAAALLGKARFFSTIKNRFMSACTIVTKQKVISIDITERRGRIEISIKNRKPFMTNKWFRDFPATFKEIK